MKITEIILNPSFLPEGEITKFTVGLQVAAGGPTVEKITFNPSTRLFNSGREVCSSTYCVFFEGTDVRKVVMSSLVSTLDLVKEQQQDAEASVGLPE